MSAFEPLDDGRAQEIFERAVAPIVFLGEPTDHPSLTLIAGQPGSGRQRAIGGAHSGAEERPAVVSAESLRAFHPHFRASRRRGDITAQRSVASTAARWLSQSFRHARTTRQSLLIEGSFPSATTVTSLAQLFADEGFRTRVVVVGVSRAESLLSLVSHHLAEARGGVRVPFPGVGLHDEGWKGTRALVAALEASPSVDRLTILDRRGDVAFDRERDETGTAFRGAMDALDTAQTPSLSVMKSVEWMGELRRVVESLDDPRGADPEVLRALVEVHELGLREVIPRLPLPENSEVVVRQERKLAGDLTRLRTELPRRRAPVPAPIGPAVGAPQPDRGGVSR